MQDRKLFFRYVIPSIFSFALSGVYAIVDGFFVGNTIGDIGLSAINVAYPISALLQALGTGIGMGGAVRYSIFKASGDEKQAREYIAGAMWFMLAVSALSTVLVYFGADAMLRTLGAQGELLSLGTEYIKIIAIGAVLQIVGVALVPFMRNYGGSFWAMAAMVGGFLTNIVMDYALVWVYNTGMFGAALATIIGQGVTMLIAVFYCAYKRNITFQIPLSRVGSVLASICRVGLAPFGLSLTPNISLILINRFSVSYGGDSAVAVYACIAYIICIIYLILQGVGDGSQPLMSRYYGEGSYAKLNSVRRMAYNFAILLALIGAAVIFIARRDIGVLFGTSSAVNAEVARIMPIFLLSIPFVAITRIITAGFYATEKSLLSYILTFIEPVLMLVLMLILPHLFGGQIMIWWSSVFARILTALLAIALNRQHGDRDSSSVIINLQIDA